MSSDSPPNSVDGIQKYQIVREDALTDQLGVPVVDAINETIRSVISSFSHNPPSTGRVLTLIFLPIKNPGNPTRFLGSLQLGLKGAIKTGLDRVVTKVDGIGCRITWTNDQVSGTIDQGSIQTALPLYETIVGDPSPEKPSELDELLVAIDSRARSRLTENQRQVIEDLTAALRGIVHVSHLSYSNINKLLGQHKLAIECRGAVHEEFGESLLGEELRVVPLDSQPSDESARFRLVIAEREKTIADLQAVLAKGEPTAAPSILHIDLTESQRVVLQAVLDLPEHGFAEAAKLMEPLVGQPMTQAFCNSFKAVLKKKSWGVICTTCGKASSVYWSIKPRYAQGGMAQFSHAAPSSHGGMTMIPLFEFTTKTYRKQHLG